jgi:parallel beta-helix repeat protein
MKHYVSSFIAVVLASVASSCTQTTDGVILIDQHRALAGNITPGDAPGFPVTISAPGSYRLASNLTVPTGLTGILIKADHVTLDLNGFIILGRLEEGTGNPDGISDDDGSVQGVTIRNGTIAGFRRGVALGTSDEIDIAGITVTDSHDRLPDAAIMVRDYSKITESKVYRNRAGGISCRRDCTIRQNVVFGNAFGIGADTNSTVAGNTSSQNDREGIYCEGTCVIIENTLYGNGNGGIHTGYGSLINHNTLFMNRGSFSVSCWENCVITENVVYGGDDYATEVGCPSIIMGNVAWSNKLFNYLSGLAPCIRVNNSPAP